MYYPKVLPFQFNSYSVPQKFNSKCITQGYYLYISQLYNIFVQTLSVPISTTKQKKLQKRTEKSKDMIGNNFYVVQHYIDSLGSFRIYSFSTY